MLRRDRQDAVRSIAVGGGEDQKIAARGRGFQIERPVNETTVASNSAGSTGFVMCA